MTGAKGQAEYKKWLMLTRDLLQETHAPQLEEAKSVTANAMLNETKNMLQELYPMEMPLALDQELLHIFESAFDVFGQVHFHPATFAVQMTPVHSSKGQLSIAFKASSMDDITGLEDDELSRCVVVGSVFPAIWKIKDEAGEAIDAFTVCKAKVMASVVEQGRG